MRTIARRVAMTLIGLGLMAGPGRAGIVTYIGEDLQPTSSPTERTNSDAAAASFRAAALSMGAVNTINFESAPLGGFSFLTVAPGVLMDGQDVDSNPQTIRNTTNFPSYPSVDGSNTTPGGNTFVEVQGGELTFFFAQPVQSFGLYLTGVQTNFFADAISFNDGTFQYLPLAGIGTSGNVGETAFFGFTDVGRSISFVTLLAGDRTTGFDDIGVDDLSYQSAPAVPEPSSLALCGIAGAVALGRARLRRRA
jgi:hypothetical protein